MRIGSLCSGYGGLDLAVMAALGGSVAWHAEIDPDAARVLAHHWPDVPNLGDLTKCDWTAVEPVDVLTAGFPCQDVSHAGKRAGIRPGTRSGLWAHVAYAIDALRPPLVVIENTGGLLSAEGITSFPDDAAGEVDGEPVGDTADGALRAIGVVLGDLATMGYDACWGVVRASDAGGAHGRARVFIAAADAADERHERGGSARHRGAGPANRGRAAADPESDGRDEGRAEPARVVGRPDAAVCGDAPPADADGRAGRPAPRHDDERGRAGDAEQVGLGDRAASDTDMRRRESRSERNSDTAQPGLTPSQRHDLDGRDQAPADPDGAGLEGREPAPGRVVPAGCAPWCAVGWSWVTDDGRDYGPAIRRQHALTRCVPPPTVSAQRKDREPVRRLSPAFTEWLMMLPAGHVTAVPGLTRNAQLRLLGNGVVPPQAELALRLLLPRLAAARGAA